MGASSEFLGELVALEFGANASSHLETEMEILAAYPGTGAPFEEELVAGEGFLPVGIPSEEAFGTPSLPDIVSGAGGIASAEDFGATLLYQGIAPVLEGVEIAQRDTSITYLVDADFLLYDEDLGDTVVVTAEYSLDNGGSWRPATPQPYDRHHSATLTDLPTTAPGKAGRFVWQAFLDLIEEVETSFTVLLRLTATDDLGLTHSIVMGPVEVSTVTPDTSTTPLDRALERRARAQGIDGGFLGNGLLIPFERVARDFAAGSDAELVRSSVREILLTRAAVGSFPGDLPWRPDFGSKLWVLRHRNNDGVLQGLAMTYVLEALLWEPRAEVTDVEARREDNILSVRVRYRVIEENTEENRVVLPLEYEETVLV